MAALFGVAGAIAQKHHATTDYYYVLSSGGQYYIYNPDGENTQVTNCTSTTVATYCSYASTVDYGSPVAKTTIINHIGSTVTPENSGETYAW
jgi:hypothetical protein